MYLNDVEEIKSLDIIQITTTKNIKYLSSPPGKATTPQGNWIVTGFIKNEVIATKEGTIIKVPISDVIKVASYSLNELLNNLKNISLDENSINLVDRISREKQWKPDFTRKVLFRYNLPLSTKTEDEVVKILQHLNKILEGE